MGPFRLIASLLVALAFLPGCEKPNEAGTTLDGPYRLYSGLASPGAGKIICYARRGGGCDIRVPPSVTAYGADDEFVTAAVRRATDAAITDYYFIVRDFDDPEADGGACIGANKVPDPATFPKKPKDYCKKLSKITVYDGRPSNCAVRGPFSRREFDALRRCHCVPEALGSDKVKCIPDASRPVGP